MLADVCFKEDTLTTTQFFYFQYFNFPTKPLIVSFNTEYDSAKIAKLRIYCLLNLFLKAFQVT